MTYVYIAHVCELIAWIFYQEIKKVRLKEHLGVEIKKQEEIEKLSYDVW